MITTLPIATSTEQAFNLRTLHIALVPGPSTPLLDEVSQGILQQFLRRGHDAQLRPEENADVILTTARFGEVVDWRDAPLFAARRRFRLLQTPTVYTLVHARPRQFEDMVARFERVLPKEPPDPADYALPGMAPQAYRTLFEQGRRGGPILSIARMVQSQAKAIHILLLLGEDRPLCVYHFDLVGAHPRSDASDLDSFYDDIVMRIATTQSSREVTAHQIRPDPIPRALWNRLRTPGEMCRAAMELGRRNFFTEMVRIKNLVHVPAADDSVKAQYSEGCFATWDADLQALVTTVTGSARPVDKSSITEDELAVIVGVRSGGIGAVIRPVENKRNDPPSAESVEMMAIDASLPRVPVTLESGQTAEVPVVRSKLHGHRGIAAYDPEMVEFVPLDPIYYRYLVSCATDSQVRAIQAAFSRSQALRNPGDPRKIVFTVLPGHGVVMAEKWLPGTAAFQVLWQAMDSGALQIASRIPQGPMDYVRGGDGRMILGGPFPVPHVEVFP